MIFRKTIAAASLLGICALAIASAPARADVSAGAGVWSQSGGTRNSTGAAALISTGRAVPVLPAEVQFTGLIPLANGGGYALTAEGRAGAAGFYGGAGAGIGRLGGNDAAGVLTAFVGKGVAPLTSVELRGYKETRSGGASAVFAGLRFSI